MPAANIGTSPMMVKGLLAKPATWLIVARTADIVTIEISTDCGVVLISNGFLGG